ncbi:MAG: filamentous hemagglutinin N-terminal domain-containing protein [Oscillatoria sp. SIO1A7]|nr:filamentous hemagglutinin N-terminal domain-containing protein [Oscillatoria sp. SIO1A7]
MAVSSILLPATARSQILPDRTLGSESSVATPEVINNIESERISGGAIRGNSLFHSFREFNIDVGRGAYFANPAAIENIFTRVTGTNASNILGTLGVLGEANLFLLNPNGILFGSEARLDLRGSFLATSADSVLFDNGFEFSASKAIAPPLLNVNIPIGLRLRSNPGAIAVRGEGTNQPITEAIFPDLSFQQNTLASDIGLRVEPGKTLALIGGELDISGGIIVSPALGRIELWSARDSELAIGDRDGQIRIENGQGAIDYSDIEISGKSVIFASGDRGTMQLSGRRISVSDGSRVEANVLGAEPAGGITVNASESLTISSSTDGQFPSLLGSRTFAVGDAGSVDISTDRLTIRDGSILGASTTGRGRAGKVTVIARESVEATGTTANEQIFSILGAESRGEGNAGEVTVETKRLIIRDGAQVGVGTDSSGRGGIVRINASESIEISGTSPNRTFASSIIANSLGAGKAGDVIVSTARLILRDGGRVEASTVGEGEGGTLTVRASELVEASGVGGNDPTVLGARARAAGNAGNVTIETKRLIARDGAFVGATTSGEGNAGTLVINASESVEARGVSPLEAENSTQLGASTTGAGNAGNITIETGRLIIENGAEVGVETKGSGAAGTVTVRASELVQVTGISPSGQDQSVLGGVTFGAGNAGQVEISTRRLVADQGGQIVVGTFGTGRAGTLIVNASESVELSGISDNGQFISGLLALSEGSGDAGEIEISTQRLTARDGAAAIADAQSEGRAGTVTVRAARVELRGIGITPSAATNSALAAVTQGAGDAGDVSIETERLTVGNGGVVLADTSGDGRAGTVTIRASEYVELGEGGSLGARTLAAGDAGNIAVETGRLTIENGSVVIVDGSGSGNPGSISVVAPEIRLSDRAGITAASATGRGGNINLTSRDIQLRRQSNISAAGSQTGNLTQEGNISLNTETLVLLQGSNIITSAADPAGGSNISIAPLDGSQLVIFQSPDSTINARGQLDIDTSIEIEPPDPTPAEIVDPADRMALHPCKQAAENRFVITGRGGLPPNPNELLEDDVLEFDLVEPVPSESSEFSVLSFEFSELRESFQFSVLSFELDSLTQKSKLRSQNSLQNSAIVPARGWTRNERGEVVLTAYDPTGKETRRSPRILGCGV